MDEEMINEVRRMRLFFEASVVSSHIDSDTGYARSFISLWLEMFGPQLGNRQHRWYVSRQYSARLRVETYFLSIEVTNQ
jgi:hypothetical protein